MKTQLGLVAGIIMTIVPFARAAETTARPSVEVVFVIDTTSRLSSAPHG